MSGSRFGRNARSALAVLTLAFTITTSSTLATAPEAVNPGPDFSTVTSKAAARKFVRTGDLVEIHFFPVELGGPDEPHNIGYVPPFAAEARQLLLRTLIRQMKEGLIDQMVVEPDYRGASIIPTRLTMKAWHSTRKGSFGGTIHIC